MKAKDIFGGELFSNFALSGALASQKLSEDEGIKEILDIQYIKEDGSIDERPVIVYRPADAEGDISLVFIPHYAAEEGSADFVSYIKNG